MSIYAIGDLHLSFSVEKPMGIFGENWENHEIKIKEEWKKTINDDDLIILPGDFSWAMHLKDTLEDFKYLNDLPGEKVLLKGNHDYWWTTIKSMNEFLLDNQITRVSFIQNNAIEYQNCIVVGTRGWVFNETDNAKKMLRRELIRLENSIMFAKEQFDDKEVICAMHYPPITKTMIDSNVKSDYLLLLKRYGIQKCIYAHLHGKSHDDAFEGEIDGIELKLVSSDFLDFKPYKIK